MPLVSATTIIQNALYELNVFQLEETIANGLINTNIQNDCLARLNMLVGEWANESLTIPATGRFKFPLIGGKGGPTNPYTIGPGGDLNIARPTSQNHVVGAGLEYGTPPFPFELEIPRGVATSEGWQQERIKDLPNTIFTWVYYRPDFSGGFGSIFLWPVPTDLTNSLVLYIDLALGTFPDLTTQFSVPDGYDAALFTNLALKLMRSYGRLTADQRMALKEDARDTLATIKRSNYKLLDQENDFATIGHDTKRGIYNILTGEGGGT